MIKLIKSILFAISYFVEFERQLVQIQCAVSDRNTILEKIILDIPFQYQKYIAWRAYRLAYWGYPLNKIANELNLMKEYLK